MAGSGLKPLALLVLALSAGSGCGRDAEQALIAVRIRSVASANARRFPPATPEPRLVSVQVLRSDQLPFGEVASGSVEWESLVEDPDTGKRSFRFEVPANEGKGFEYLVKVSSLVDDGGGELVVDECGVTGRVIAPAGRQVVVEIGTHLGDCSPLLCQTRSDCVGTTRYCLSFECYDRASCGACPEGAQCGEDGFCTGDCSSDSDCAEGFTCCLGTCSRACQAG
ncbi:MAG: hypothetical protein D6806_02090 [Deltaproteobacteria bacterium]|nr:MAG: hypothetical protein D6806_02090 [Deltaproteobacteria bacterium]